MTNEDVVKNLQHLIGTPYVPTVKAYISELTDRPRVIGLEEMSTKEFDPQRINLAGDDASLITGFNFN